MTRWDGLLPSTRIGLCLSAWQAALSSSSRHADNEPIYGPQPTIASVARQIGALCNLYLVVAFSRKMAM